MTKKEFVATLENIPQETAAKIYQKLVANKGSNSFLAQLETVLFV